VADSPARDPLSDEALAGVYRAARQPAGDHLSPEQWERLTCDELRGADFDRALAHIESCGECTAIHRGLLDLRHEATALEAGDAVQVRAGGRRRWTLVGGLAAAAALVAAVLINQPGRTTLSNDVTRSGETRIAIEMVTPAPGSAFANRRFEWKQFPGATAYLLRVDTADGALVWATRVAATTAQLPENVAMPGGAYYWQVTALRGEAVLASSLMVAFRAN
jgi:hypothetical protein